MPTFADAVAASPTILTDGGIETRLIYEFRLDLPEFASFLPLVRPGERHVLETIYRGYLEIAASHRLPIQLGTPTWRAHPGALDRLGHAGEDGLARINRMAVDLLVELRRETGMAGRAFIAGVVGPRRDGYDPASAPDAAAAQDYHGAQIAILAAAGVDLLYAPTFASAAEIEGVAAAMAATGLPYVLAPVIDARGRLLDGTPMAELVVRIDSAMRPPPLHYMIGCVHPSRLHDTAGVPSGNTPAAAALAPVRHRIAGLKGNASTLPPEALDRLDHLDEGRPEAFAAAMVAARGALGLKILGGCCGTSDRHIEALARRLSGGG